MPNIFIIIGVIVSLIVAQEISVKRLNRSKASVGNAKIFIQPVLATIPPNKTLQVWITVDKPVGFVEASLSFDPSKIALTQDLIFTNIQLSRVIDKSTLIQANTTGKFLFAIGLDPTQIATAPTGTFQLASIEFISKTTTSDVSTNISFDATKTSAVDMGVIGFTMTTQGANVVLNPTVVSTATPTSGITSVRRIKREGLEIGSVQTNGATAVRTSVVVPTGTNMLYMSAISTKPNISVQSVSGLGLSWQRAGAQCGARGQTRTELWWAYGSPTAADYVTAVFSNPTNTKAAVMGVVRYSGAQTPIVTVVRKNTFGVNSDMCTGGKDVITYVINVTNTSANSMLFGAVGTRDASHTAQNGFTDIMNIRTNRKKGDNAGVALVEKTMTEIGIQTVKGIFTRPVDFSGLVVEIRSR